MSLQPTPLTEPLYRYLLSASVREPEICKELRLQAKLRDSKHHNMQIGPETGQFLAFLLQLTSSKRCLEVGTYMGYSSLWLALHLPTHGKLVTCDISLDWNDLACQYWQKAGVLDKIEFQAGPALESLAGLLQQEQGECFDFAFIDADKSNYAHYYELCLSLVKPGGILAFDNMFWGGNVACDSVTDSSTQALRDLNLQLGLDERVDFHLLPIGDGLGLAWKKEKK